MAAAEAQVQACKAAAAMAREAGEKAKQTRDALRAQQETERLRAEAEVCSFTLMQHVATARVCVVLWRSLVVCSWLLCPPVCMYEVVQRKEAEARRKQEAEERRRKEEFEARVAAEKVRPQRKGKVALTSKRYHCCG